MAKPTSPHLQKDHKPTMNAWAFYDWANSVYNLIITTAIFPVYYNAATKAAFSGDVVPFLGFQVKNSVLYSYAISFSFVMIALISPMLSGIADYSGRKKRFMQFFTYMGSVACLSLYFFDGTNVEWGIFFSIMASLGYAGSLVFYNAFLPEVASPPRHDHLSAKGFSMGYIGSVILLLLTIAMVQLPETFGFPDEGAAIRFSFLMVGVWWAAFAQVTFYYLKDRPTHNPINAQILVNGFRELRKVWDKMSAIVAMKKYLSAFFFYNMGVQTTIYLATIFAGNELGLGQVELIAVILILQLVAIAGAYFFAYVSKKAGNKISLVAMLLIWILVCVGAYFVQTSLQFYGLASMVGLVLGGIQSLSRSTYAKMIPENTRDTASFFSFYDVTEKLSIVIGTFSYGLVEQLTGSMRNSSLALAIFFIIGLVILLQTKLPKAGQ